MHTLLMILGGIALMAAVYGIAFWRGLPLRQALPVYAVLWAVAAAINLWVGVAHAGYSVAEELPIFAIIFGVPCLLAWFLARRLA
ncbi:hypothetical protein [Nitratireductor alexandrii]|uniref:hypothetical protein n=1 Tax=Nitratireductor alexandrii TaxID=2448161 RepID=UPI000FD8C3AE|nr:hypothetical protein [Nitratireductor alexandrii]